MAAQLKEENDKLNAEMEELKKQLEQEKEERERLEKLLADSQSKGEELEGMKLQLEGQVTGLQVTTTQY